MSEEVGTYRFTGADGSLGYRHGRVYTLRVLRPGRHWPVEIWPDRPSGFCPYSSEAAFRANWEPVE